MRIKNEDKKIPVEETADGVMGLRTRNRFGNKCAPEEGKPDEQELRLAALDAIRALHFALGLPSRVPSPRPPGKESSDQYREQFWQFVATYYARDWANHDGRLFRALADAMEVHLRPNNPAWTFVCDEIIVRRLAGLEMPTVTEMFEELSRRGIQTTRKTVERIFAHMSVERVARRGPRAGSRRKGG